MLLDALPRVRLAHLPTPIEELNSLSRLLAGPRIFIKRDDCTGLATGGNKTSHTGQFRPYSNQLNRVPLFGHC